MKFAIHFYNDNVKRQPIACSTRFGWSYQPRHWTRNKAEVTCKHCLVVLARWEAAKAKQATTREAL